MISRVSRILPTRIKSNLSPLFFKFKSIQVNRQYEPPTSTCERRSEAPDHILIITIDALRPDYKPDINVDFNSAIAPGTWTFPSVTSIHTGLRPSDHQSIAHTFSDDGEYAMPKQSTSRPILSKTLDAAGYDTFSGTAFLTPILLYKVGIKPTRFTTTLQQRLFSEAMTSGGRDEIVRSHICI